MTVSGRARGAGHQHLLYRDGRSVTVQEAFDKVKAIKLMAIITSIVLVAPIIGPLSGGAMHFVHWKVLFAIIAVMVLSPLWACCWRCRRRSSGAVPFSAISVVRDFRDVFRNRVFLGRRHDPPSYIPMMSWVAVSPVILIDGWHDVLPVRLVQVRCSVRSSSPQHGRCSFCERSNPRFIWRAVPIQLSGLFVLIAEPARLTWWLWSVLAPVCMQFGIGLIFPDAVFRFTLFTNNLPKEPCRPR